MRVITVHLISSLLLSVLLGLWFYPAASPLHQQLMQMAALLFAGSLLIFTLLERRTPHDLNQLGYLYASDTFLAALLIFATGGIDSPLAFLLGLIVIAAGSHAARTLPIVIAVFSCIGYLCAIYADFWLIRNSQPSQHQALHLLLQVSALLLIGGVMAYIAKRQAALQDESSQAIRQQHRLTELHNNIMREMHEGVILLDKQQQIRDMNDAARHLVNDDLITQILTKPELRSCLQQAHPSCQCEYSHQNKELLLTLRRLSQHTEAQWLLTIVDISHLRGLEKKLIEQEKMAILGEMAAMLAHEIRNPINTMSQSLELITQSPQHSTELTRIMQEEFHRLERLVHMMLEYAKPLDPHPAATQMPSLIESAIQQCGIDPARIQYDCQIDTLHIDADHFRIVLDNLLTNALQNSDGDVTITLAAEEEKWSLSLCNHGNIPADMVEQIFQPFVSGRSQGIGLGLATVQQICHANHWQVALKQESGQTCFIVHALSTPATAHADG